MSAAVSLVRRASSGPISFESLKTVQSSQPGMDNATNRSARALRAHALRSSNERERTVQPPWSRRLARFRRLVVLEHDAPDRVLARQPSDALR